MLARLFLAAAFVFLAAGATQAAKRIGLVIGNDTYAHVPVLEKARSDARAIGRALSGVGFDVTSVLDAGRSIGGSRGLARITAPEGTFVVFSAGAGQQALDRLKGADTNPNSVFTRTLLPKLKEGGNCANWCPRFVWKSGTSR